MSNFFMRPNFAFSIINIENIYFKSTFVDANLSSRNYRKIEKNNNGNNKDFLRN